MSGLASESPARRATLAAAPARDAAPGAPRRRRRYGGLVVLAGCTAGATASLAVPALLGVDPWVWLIWGREALRGSIATDGSVAWKPLPVLVTAPASVFGEAAPALWTVAVRAGGLFGLVLVVRLAARLARPHGGSVAAAVAGAVAAAAFVLGPDGESRWIRHMLQANIEPVTAMLCLWAVERHLDGRRWHALLLLCAAALTRPEAWPFLAGYGAWVLWCERRRWWAVPGVLAVLAAVPLLWFAGDRLVSGNALSGATVAQVLVSTIPRQRWLLAMDNVAACVIVPVWVAAAVCVVWAAHLRRGLPAVLAACALGWAAEVVVMAGVFGYAALGRFLTPVAAVLCVLAGVAVGWVVAAPGPRRSPVLLRGAVAVVLVAAAVPFAAPRVAWLPLQVQQAGERSVHEQELYAVAAALGGREGLRACGDLAIDTVRPAVELRFALAYRLDLPLAGVRHNLPTGTGTTVAQVGSPLHAAVAARPPGEVALVHRSTRWAVFTELCRRPA